MDSSIISSTTYELVITGVDISHRYCVAAAASTSQGIGALSDIITVDGEEIILLLLIKEVSVYE